MHVRKCWNRAPYLGRKRTCFSVVNFKPRTVLILHEQNGCLNTCVSKNIFSLYSFTLKKKDSKCSLKHVLESYDTCNNSPD